VKLRGALTVDTGLGGIGLLIGTVLIVGIGLLADIGLLTGFTTTSAID